MVVILTRAHTLVSTPLQKPSWASDAFCSLMILAEPRTEPQLNHLNQFELVTQQKFIVTTESYNWSNLRAKRIHLII